MHIFSRIFLPFLLLGYITTETYLKLQHKSLCGEVGCKFAGELLNFDPLYLNYAGMVGVFVLMILGYLSLKSKFFGNLFFMGLYGGVAFEATILSYQFVSNPEPCIFCLGIFSSLLLIALFSQVKHFTITIATVLAIFVGMNTLAVTKNKSFVTENGYYLIQSETCPHCKTVKAYLAKNNIEYTPISTQEASARSFLKFVNTSSIPVLIIKEKLETKMFTGDKKIIAHFESQKDVHVQQKQEETQTTQTAPIQSSNMGFSSGGFGSDFLSEGGDDAGCAITVTAEQSCDDENKTAN